MGSLNRPHTASMFETDRFAVIVVNAPIMDRTGQDTLPEFVNLRCFRVFNLALGSSEVT